MKLMRGPKEETLQETVEEKEDFGMLKPLGSPPLPEETGPPALLSLTASREENEKQESSPSTPRSSGEESGEITSEEGQEGTKEEQMTLQDLLG